MSGPKIYLEPSSLYISTQVILAETGKYHWAIYVTNLDGYAIKYHWATLERSDLNLPVEGLKVGSVNPVTTYSRAYTLTLGFFKVDGYRPIGSDDMLEITKTAFPEQYQFGFSSIRENRRHGLSCRTWVLAVLGKLHGLGYLRRQEGPQYFEDAIKNYSAELEQQVAQGFLEQSAVIVI